MMLTLRARETEMPEIVIEHLNYGKLAVGDNLRVPTSEGYAITRRSKGLNGTADSNFLPPRLLDIKRFERELIDEPSRKRGCLVVWPAKALRKMAVLRARFRSEDGEDGNGRLYQQIAIWVVRVEDWAAYPGAIITAAAGLDKNFARKLEARPDLLSDSVAERLQADPLVLAVPPRAPPRTPMTSGAKKILRNLLPSPLTREVGEDRRILMGQRDFPDEEAFLAAVSEALSSLSPAFGRWDDIRIVSGLRHEAGGLFVRYLPSEPGDEHAEVSDAEIHGRLKVRGRGSFSSPSAYQQASNAVRSEKEATFRVASRGVDQSVARNAVPSAPAAPSAPAVVSRNSKSPAEFAEALRRYSTARSPENANALLRSADEFARMSPAVVPGSLSQTGKSILSCLRSILLEQFANVRLGGLMDMAELFYELEKDIVTSEFDEKGRVLFKALAERLQHVEVFLPTERARLSASPFAERLRISQGARLNSDLLSQWMQHASQAGERMIVVDQRFSGVLAMLSRRVAQSFTPLCPNPQLLGAHDTYLVEVEGIFDPAEYSATLQHLLQSTMMQHALVLRSWNGRPRNGGT
jgi:hypothetical protein